MTKRILFFIFSIIAFQSGECQSLFSGLEHLFTTPKSYTAVYTPIAPVIDGKINDTIWDKASWTDEFVDIEGNKKPLPAYKTKVKMLWGDSCFYVAAQLEEPHVWATLKQHDAIVYHDNDFEIFIDPDNDTHQYFEIEVNAYNTIFDLLMPKPYRNGGNALIPFEVASLRTGVAIQGSINNPSNVDSGWTVEMAIPFRALTFGNTWKVPAEGTQWRVNFSRVQWDTDVVNGAYTKKKNAQGKNLPEHNWVWSPQGVINMHYPERWGYVTFTRNAAGSESHKQSYTEQQRQYLWLVYYKQQAFYAKQKKYAATLSQLGLSPNVMIDGSKNKIKLQATPRQFTAFIHDGKNESMIKEDGQVKKLK